MELYEHQEELINQAKPILRKYKLVYIAAETRTGKTLAAIHLLKDDFKKILVVTKKKAISSWNSDIKLSKVKNFVRISEYSDSNAGVQPDTFAMRFSRL